MRVKKYLIALTLSLGLFVCNGNKAHADNSQWVDDSRRFKNYSEGRNVDKYVGYVTNVTYNEILESYYIVINIGGENGNYFLWEVGNEFTDTKEVYDTFYNHRVIMSFDMTQLNYQTLNVITVID